MLYILSLFLVGIGLYGLLLKRNLVKMIIGFVIMEAGVHLFLILIGYRRGGEPPVMKAGEDLLAFAGRAVDPLPQAMVLTSIVIGLGLLILMVALTVRIYERHHTINIKELRRLRG
jgi:multicomponent Na+:H+ antiporter subunit C